MKDFKSGCIGIFIWFVFSWFSTVYVYHSIAPPKLVIGVILLLPTLCLISFMVFIQVTQIAVLIYKLLTFPLRIFRKRKTAASTSSTPPPDNSTPPAYLPFLISFLLYAVAAWLLNLTYPNPLWLPTLCLLGFLWGSIFFIAVKKEVFTPENF